jgi:transposase
MFLNNLRRWQDRFGTPQVLVAMEPTGHYWESFAEYLCEEGVPFVFVNPFHTNRAKELLDNSPGKSDAKDARIIASLAVEGRVLEATYPRGEFAELRRLAMCWKTQCEAMTRETNRLHRILDQVFPQLPSLFGDIAGPALLALLKEAATAEQCLQAGQERLTEILKRASRGRLGQERARQIVRAADQAVVVREGQGVLRLELQQILARIEMLREQGLAIERAMREALARIPYASIMTSLRPLGENTAAVVLGELGDLRQYRSAEELLKVAGLNLYEISSGTRRGSVHVTKRGRPLLRWVLYLAASRLMKSGAPFHEFNGRLKRNGKPGDERVVAVARKTLRVLHAMVRDEKPFDPQRAGSMAGERVGG